MPNHQENSCDCEACKWNAEQDAKRAAFFASMQEEFDQAAKPVEVSEEDKELAKGRTVVISKKLREEMILDSLVAKVVRLTPREYILFSGKGRLATRAEQQAMI